MVLAIDTSGSMLAGQHRRGPRPPPTPSRQGCSQGTRMGVVAFSDQPVVVQELTSDLEQVRAAIRGSTAQGDTALYDAVIQSSELLGKEEGATEPGAALGRPPRRPTHDHHAGDRRGQQERGGHLHGRPGGPGGDENSANLERMAKATGGEAFSADPEQLERLYEILAHHAGLPVRRQHRRASRPRRNGELPAPGAGQRRHREVRQARPVPRPGQPARRRYPPGRLRRRRCRGWRASRGGTSSPSPGSPPSCWPACCCSGPGRVRAGRTGRCASGCPRTR